MFRMGIATTLPNLALQRTVPRHTSLAMWLRSHLPERLRARGAPRGPAAERER
jgi:hypothetical protein